MIRGRSASGFTVIELLVVIIILAILAAILFPVFASTHCKSSGYYCQSNLRRLGTAAFIYARDWDDRYPSSGAMDQPGSGPWGKQSQGAASYRSKNCWVAQLLPYLKTTGTFACPMDARREQDQMNRKLRGAKTPFLVSYGPNRLFMTPLEYGWKKRSLSTADV
jgi:prepilin-type N-terminal cleavage/methylation domain-containing protein